MIVHKLMMIDNVLMYKSVFKEETKRYIFFFFFYNNPPPPKFSPFPHPAPLRICLLIRRSASGFPPVWQVGQYWRLESAKDTSRTMSPHTGHASPVRPCTARLLFFSLFSSLEDRKSTRLNSSHANISYAVFCLKKK